MSQKEFIPQLASIEQCQAHTRCIRSKLAARARLKESLPNKPEDRYHISQMQNFPEDLILFIRKNSADPLMKVCRFQVVFIWCSPLFGTKLHSTIESPSTTPCPSTPWCQCLGGFAWTFCYCWHNGHRRSFNAEPSCFPKGSNLSTPYITGQLYHIWHSLCSRYYQSAHWSLGCYATVAFGVLPSIFICMCPGHLPCEHNLHWPRHERLSSQVHGISVGALVWPGGCASWLGAHYSWSFEICADNPGWCVVTHQTGLVQWTWKITGASS